MASRDGIVWRGFGKSKRLYLVDRVVKPGDVLLTLGYKPHSLLIASATGGPISHAAIIVTGSTLFESRTFGIGMPDLIPDRIEIIDRERCHLHCLHDCLAAVVLRSEPFQTFDNFMDQFMKVLDTIQALGDLGREYSDWDQLLKVFNPNSGFVRWSQKMAAWMLDATDGRKMVEGPFCSHLVARFFKQLGIPLGKDGDFPAIPSPVALLDANLVLVERAIRCAEPTAKTDDETLRKIREHAERIGRLDSNERIKASVQLSRDTEKLRTLADRVATRAAAASDPNDQVLVASRKLQTLSEELMAEIMRDKP